MFIIQLMALDLHIRGPEVFAPRVRISNPLAEEGCRKGAIQKLNCTLRPVDARLGMLCSGTIAAID